MQCDLIAYNYLEDLIFDTVTFHEYVNSRGTKKKKKSKDERTKTSL